jgi:ferredoxin
VTLLDAAERLASINRSEVTLSEERCLHSLDRSSACQACLDICPAGAISPDKPPKMEPEKCQRCLACLTACPVGAFKADDSVVSLLNAVSHLEGGALELLCEKNANANSGSAESCTGIRVRGCLAGLGSGTYVALAAFGLERILVRTDACDSCNWRSLPSLVIKQINEARRLLEGWQRAELLQRVVELDQSSDRPLWEAANPPLSRRDMFRMLGQQGKVAMARAIEHERTEVEHRPGRNRMRLTSAVAHLPAPTLDCTSDLADMNFAAISVSEACTACGVCARACPTNALRFEKNEESTEFNLKLSVRDCIGCEICRHVCAPSAISLDHAPTFAKVFGQDIITLRGGELTKCKHCGILMAARPDTQLCLLCEYRQTQPFGSMLPPGAQLQFQKNKQFPS